MITMRLTPTSFKFERSLTCGELHRPLSNNLQYFHVAHRLHSSGNGISSVQLMIFICHLHMRLTTWK